MGRTLKSTRVPFQSEKKVKTVVRGTKGESDQVEDEQIFARSNFWRLLVACRAVAWTETGYCGCHQFAMISPLSCRYPYPAPNLHHTVLHKKEKGACQGAQSDCRSVA